jgi:tetratricopeptide (TPR) repeat protein
VGGQFGLGPTPARAKALTGAGGIAWWQEDMAAAQLFYEEALAIERELGDPAGIAEALYNQGFILGARGDFDAAVRLFEESLELFRGAGDETGMARAEWMIVIRDLIAGDLDGTVARAEEAVATWRRVGDRFHLGDGLVWLAVLYARAGRLADARRAILQALELVREIDSPMGVVSVILGLAYVARWAERHEDAMRLIGAAESLRERVGGGAPINFLAGFMGDPAAEARAHLSQEAAQRAIKEGRTMSVDAALALAVGDDATTEAPRDPA